MGMGYRLYDWMCDQCGAVAAHLVWADSGSDLPREHEIECASCDTYGRHERIVSLVAEYHGERVLNPPVYGGAFDTMGMREVPHMDPLPVLPDDASSNDRKEQIDAYRDRFASAEWKDLQARRDDAKKENTAKRKRASALARGETVNMRRDKLPGDPKVTA